MMVACSVKSPSGQIDAMLKRVTVVERRVDKLYDGDFSYLVKEYAALDTTVARQKDINTEMVLLPLSNAVTV